MASPNTHYSNRGELDFGPPQFDTDLLSSIGQPSDPLRPKVLGCRNYDGKTVVLTYRPPQTRNESPVSGPEFGC